MKKINIDKIIINKKSKMERCCYNCKYLRECSDKYKVVVCEKFAFSAAAKSIYVINQLNKKNL